MRIAILSQNSEIYSTRRLVEAGRRAGHRMSVVDYMRCSIGVGGPRPVSYLGGPFPKVDAFIPRIAASNTFHGVSLVRRLQQMGLMTPVGADALASSRDKLRCLQLLDQAGVPIPASAFGSDMLDARGLVEAVGGPPVVVKVLEGTQGVGVMLCDTQNGAESTIEALRSLRANVLVQELIEEARGTDLRCIVVEDKVVASMVRTAQEGEFRSNLHRGGSSARSEVTAREREVAVAAAKAVGLRLAGVDILRSARGPLVVEVNSSPGLEGVEKVTRLDIAGAIIRRVAKLPRRSGRRASA